MSATSSFDAILLDVGPTCSLQPFIDFSAPTGSDDAVMAAATMLWAVTSSSSSSSSSYSSCSKNRNPTVQRTIEGMDTYSPPPSWTAALEGRNSSDFSQGKATAAAAAAANRTTRTAAPRLVPLPKDALKDIFGIAKALPTATATAKAAAQTTAAVAPGPFHGQGDPMRSCSSAERLSDSMVLSCDDIAQSLCGGDVPSWLGSLEESAMSSLLEDMRSITVSDGNAAPPPVVEAPSAPAAAITTAVTDHRMEPLRAPPGLLPLPSVEPARQGLPDDLLVHPPIQVQLTSLPPGPPAVLLPPVAGPLARAVTFDRARQVFHSELGLHRLLQKPRPTVVIDNVVCYVLDPAVDVLCQRGGLGNGNDGNQKYRNDRDALRSKYLATKADREKTRLSSQLVQQVYDRNGLFWKKRTDGSDVWEEVSFKVARSKASQALRDGRKAPATGEGQLH